MLKSYRSISLLSNISKVLETLVYNKVLDYEPKKYKMRNGSIKHELMHLKPTIRSNV